MSTKRNRQKREALRKEQGNRCFYCKCEMNNTPGSPYRCTLEHRKRRADGGTNAWRNLVAACQACNLERGARDERRNPGGTLNNLARENKTDWDAFGWKVD